MQAFPTNLESATTLAEFAQHVALHAFAPNPSRPFLQFAKQTIGTQAILKPCFPALKHQGGDSGRATGLSAQKRVVEMPAWTGAKQATRQARDANGVKKTPGGGGGASSGVLEASYDVCSSSTI